MVCQYTHGNQTFSAVELDEKLKGLPLSQLRMAVEGLAAEVASESEPEVKFSFAGRKAKTAAHDALATAKEALAKGASAQVVRRETGWFKGADGLWRFEITDHDAQLKFPGDSLPDDIKVHRVDGKHWVTLKLSEVLEHPRLFAAYPELANMDITLQDYNTGALGTQGEYHKDFGGFIRMPNSFHKRPIAEASDGPFGITQEEADAINAENEGKSAFRLSNPKGMLSTLLHELQHAIQEREGFADGGAPSQGFADQVRDALKSIHQDTREAVQNWRLQNSDVIDEAQATTAKARYALMYESAQRLQSYADRDSPSGVMRLIRQEMQWIYEPEFAGHPLASQLQRDFYAIPKPSKLAERNRFLADFARRGALLLQEHIPHELQQSFASDTRQLKSLVKALAKQSQKAREKLEPLSDLQRKMREAGDIAMHHANASPMQIYTALAGEVEARNVEARQHMTEEERRNRPPEATEDVERRYQIVLMQDSTMQSPHLHSVVASLEPQSSAATPDMSYQIDHKPLTKEGGAASLDDLTAAFPDDIYSAQALQFYGSGDPREKAALKVMQSVRGNPDAKVSIYRGVPSGVNAINAGDWVTLSKDVAQDYADQHDGGKVISMQVPAAHVTAWADSLLEFGYYPAEDAKQSVRRTAVTETPEFKAWFGNSKVVDANGKPLVVYHGTNADFSVFKPSKTGTFGPGIYFADSGSDAASAYGDNIVDAYLSIQNPWLVDADPDSDAAYEEDHDNPAVEAVLSLPNGRALLDKAKREESEHFDEDLKNELISLGYDGVIATYPDGSKEFVAFNPSQVKSATGNNGNFDPANPDIRYSVSRLPRAIIGDTLGALAKHPDYQAAKAGDEDAAMRVAADIVNAELVSKLQGVQADAVLGVMVDEAGGVNMVPTAAAAQLASSLGLPMGHGVYKSAGAKRTTLLGLERVFSRPTFAGSVPAGTRFIVLDDTLTQGGTIAAMAEHLHAQGAEVAAVVALTGKNYSSQLAPSESTIARLRAQLGDVENDFEQATGRRFADLTESEARYLANYRPQEAVRARIAQATERGSAAPDGSQAGSEAAVKQSARRTPQEETEAFKRWFGDSKVVDADGKPLVVYHGTQAEFTEFDREVADETIGGWWFTDDGNYAYDIARGGWDVRAPGVKANVMDVYLSIQNPVFFDVLAEGEKLAEEIGVDAPADANEAQELLSGGIGWDQIVKDMVRDAKRKGHDGLVITNFQDGRLTTSTAYIAFRPEQIKSATGNNGNFDPTDPDIRRSVRRSNAAWQGPSASKWDDMVYRLQDKQVDAKRVVDEIAKVNGAIQDDLDVYLNERLFHGRSAKRTQDFVNDELNPLVKDMAKAGLKIEDLDEYLHARHAKEANRVIAERNPDIPDGGSGMTNDEVDNYFAKLSAKDRAVLERMAAKVDAIMAKTRQLYVDYELESQATVDSWGQMFQHYVPLMREDQESRPGIGQGYSVKGRETKGRTGSTRKVVDILANIAMQRERAIVRGEKNRVAQALVGLATANPNAQFWEVDQPKVEQVFNPKTGLVENRVDPMWKNRENAIVAKVREADGSVKEHAVVFNERNERALRMAESLKNLDAAQLEGLWGASAQITRYFSAINTQYNPVFGIVNFVRDVQGAAINLASTPLKGQQRKVLRNVLPALAGIWSDLRAQRNGAQGKGQWAALWDEFQMVGGQTGYRDLFRTSADRADAIRQTLDPYAWMQSKWGKIFTAGGALKVPMAVAQKHLGWMFDMLSDYNEAIENGVRLSAYKAGLDQGMSKERAAALAKNLTVDFNKKGQVAQQAGALYAFFNAAMQGTARMGEVLVTMEPGKPKTMRLSSTGKKIVGGGMLLGAMQALAMAAAGFDEENPPEFVRERALIIPTFGLLGSPEKGYISIPMPLGLHVIPNIGRSAVEFAMSGFEKPAQRAIALMAVFADAFNPIGNAGMSVQTLTPTALDPLVALTENRDFAGRPIAKESRNEAVPGHALGRDTSTVVGKAVAEAINWLSGGNEYVSGALSPTPDQIDYLIGQIFGGVGREYSKVEQTLTSAFTGEELATHKIPLVGRLVGNAEGQSSQSGSFYANLERVNRVETQAKAMREDGKREEAREFLQTRPERYLMAKANSAERQLQKLRQKKRELIKNGADATQVKRVEEQITDVMKRFNDAVAELKSNQKA